MDVAKKFTGFVLKDIVIRRPSSIEHLVMAQTALFAILEDKPLLQSKRFIITLKNFTLMQLAAIVIFLIMAWN
jgi:hypothetical protein